MIWWGSKHHVMPVFLHKLARAVTVTAPRGEGAGLSKHPGGLRGGEGTGTVAGDARMGRRTVCRVTFTRDINTNPVCAIALQGLFFVAPVLVKAVRTYSLNHSRTMRLTHLVLLTLITG